MSRPRVYQLMGAAELTTRLSTVVDKGPTSERQARPLAKLEPEQQPTAWNRAVEIADGKPPTAGQVEQAVIELVINRGDKAPQEVLAVERKRRRKRELIRRPYRELKHAWSSAIDVQQKCLLKAILAEPKYKNWLHKELGKIEDKDTIPDPIGASEMNPITHIFDELREEVLLCNWDLMTDWILKFVTNEQGDVDDDRAKMLLRSCATYYDSPLTVLLDIYGNNPKEIVERLLGLRAIES